MGSFVKLLIAAGVTLFALGATAQTTTVSTDDNFNELIKPDTEIARLGPDLFGDKVALYTGSTDFDVTDVTLPSAHNLPVSVGRRFVVEERSKSQIYGGNFGDWDLDIPHLHGTFAAASGWQVATSTPNARCSVPSEFFNSQYQINATPPVVSGTNGGLFASPEYWHGNEIYIPGTGDRTMMVIDPSNTQHPNDGKTYHWVTSDHWVFSCISATANGVPGEGFAAKSPQGVTYNFDWIVSRPYAQIEKPVTICTVPQPQCSTQLARSEIWILPTKAQDRFGNTVTYTYDPAKPWHLISITASDGRSISISYNNAGLISSVTTGSRVWTYQYSALGSLQKVTLPDNSSWTLDFSQVEGFISSTSLHSDCPDPPNFFGTAGIAKITHPSGAKGEFTFSPHMHGRSYVPRSCVPYIGGASYAAESDTINVISIDSKSISGPGFSSALVWNYTYGPLNRSFAEDCSTSTSCPSTKTVTIENPDGTTSVHTFSNRYNNGEGKLLEVDAYSGTTLVRKETTGYQLDPAGMPYPATVGRSPCYRCDAGESQPVPVTTHVITQDGVTYSAASNAFDTFARATSITRSNTLGFSKVDSSTFYDNLTLWVLGEPSQQKVNGIETAHVVYDNSNALPTAHYVFGALKSQYAYFTDGTIKSITNGRNYTTSVGGWKRGKPTSLLLPDQQTEHFGIDDYGDITSVTDQSGATTTYTYNGVGRVTEIDYPPNDEKAWNPTKYTYDFVQTTERGIAAYHWRRTILKGDARRVTYYDGWFQPILVDIFSATDSSTHSNVRTTYDWRGHTTFESYPVDGSPDLGGINLGVHTSYDALGRVQEVDQDSDTTPLKTITNYPTGTLATRVTDPNQNVTTTNYVSYDDPSYDIPIKVTAPEGITQTITRDAFNSVTAITQSGLYGTESDSVVKKFYYDPNRRLCRVYEPESGNTVMNYDAADNRTFSAQGIPVTGEGCGLEQVSASAGTSYSYDEMNRLKTEQPPGNGQSTSIIYTPIGKVQSVTSGITVWSGVYNKLGELTSESMDIAGLGTKQLLYAHDVNGSPASTTFPDGITVDYAADSLGRPTKAGAYASAATYFPDGTLKYLLYGNGTEYLAQKNSRDTLKNYTYIRGSTIDVSEDFQYDNNGNILSITDLNGGTRSKTFTYDGINRLRSANAANLWGTETYTYDPLNNIRSRSRGGQSLSYQYDSANRLSSVMSGGTTLESIAYDTRGNTQSIGNMSLVFDTKNQLLSIVGKDSYAYDGAGRRVKKSPLSGGASTFYFYTQAGQLLYQYNAALFQQTDFIYLGGKLVARSVRQDSAIRGAVSGVITDSMGNASLTGWACSFGSTTPVNADAYSGSQTGTHVGTVTANASNGLGTASDCGVSNGAYGFSIPLDETLRASHAGEALYVFGANSAGTDRLILAGSGVATIPALPAAPTAPTQLSTVATTDLTAINVGWTAASGATSYVLQESLNGGAWSNAFSGATNSFSLPNPGDGTYKFQVKACNITACSAWTISSALSVSHVPPAPGSISTPSTSTGSVPISWSSASFATSYVLERSLNGGAWGSVFSGGALSFTDHPGATGTYAYRVKGCSASGCGAYRTSGNVAVTLAPSASPTISALGTVTSSGYTVSWTAVGGATSYTLQEQVDNGSWSSVQTSASRSWAASGKSDNTTYGYRVEACNVAGCGAWSPTVSAHVSLLPALAPTPSVTGTSGRIASITASWSAATRASSYNVELTLPDSSIISTTQTGTSYSYGLIHYSGQVKVRINACNASGCSGWSGYGSVYVTATGI